MSLLKNLNTETDIADEKDSIGGGNNLLDSDLYGFKVALAYLQKSTGGALGLFLTLKTEDGKELKTNMYLTSGNDKGNKNYYEGKDKQKHYLPGFNLANSLALLTTGKQIGELAETTEMKVVNIYDYDTKGDIPTKVEVITELIGADINAGVLRQTVDKRKKGDDGKYVSTGETRDENEIDKFFCAKDKYLNMTATEIKSKVEKAVFVDQWVEANKGKVKDKTTKAGGTSGTPAKSGGGAGAAAKPANSLFGGDDD
jgi:hypothetical protein